MALNRLITVVLASIFLVPSVSFSESARMDSRLSLIIKDNGAQTVAKRQGILRSTSASAEPLVSTIIKFQGDLSGVESLGGRVGSVIGDVATVDVPLSVVDAVSKLNNIVFMEAAKKVRHHLDASVPETGANLLRSGAPPNWTGSTGKNVVIGIVDTGIDLNHADFKDSSGGSRILFLWDQTTGGIPPSGFAYGNECAKAKIDAKICTETDTDGHGTHIAGIAAGNGAATGNGQPQFRFIGMAPEADIIIVKTTSDTVGILDGIAYIQGKAASLGKPSVINISLGGHVDPHDGTSLFEQGLDGASGQGKVIVCAAGNEGNANIHASGTVSRVSPVKTDFNAPAGSASQNIDIWYAGADQMGIKIDHTGTPVCTTSIVIPGVTTSFDTACGRIQIDNSSTGINPNNGDREITVNLLNGTSPLASGAWSFTLSGTVIANGRFDSWIDDTVTSPGQFTSNVDATITLDDCGTATKPISVAAYNTKNIWKSINGQTFSYSPPVTLGDIAAFSSRGPRRQCSNIALCPSVQKPEIAAPGQGIMSSLSASSTQTQSLIDPDGVHFLNQGTSMAAPHVAGAAALLLQSNTTLTSDQIKNALTSKTKADSFTGALPNNIWGFGKMDVAAAFGVTPAPAPGGGGGGGGGGCFIATAAFGSYLDPNVVVLRDFRDRYLLTSAPGRAFVGLYYRVSPPFADFIRKNDPLRVAVLFGLTPVVYVVKYPLAAFIVMAFIAILIIPSKKKGKSPRK